MLALSCPEDEEARRRNAGREPATEMNEAARRAGTTSLALISKDQLDVAERPASHARYCRR
jgi:hypothetical protein